MQTLIRNVAFFAFLLPLAACGQGDEPTREPAAPQERQASQAPPTSDVRLNFVRQWGAGGLTGDIDTLENTSHR